MMNMEEKCAETRLHPSSTKVVNLFQQNEHKNKFKLFKEVLVAYDRRSLLHPSLDSSIPAMSSMYRAFYCIFQ